MILFFRNYSGLSFMIKVFKFLTIPHCLALVTGMTFISVTQATTLLQSVEAANNFDSEISAARHSQQAAGERRTQGVAGLLPRIQLDSSYTKQDQPHASYAAAVKRHNYSVNLSQPLFDMSKYADYQRGEAVANSADMEMIKAQQKLITDVAEAFFNVLLQRESLQTAGAAKQAFSQQLAQMQASLQVGEGTKADVAEAQANHDKAIAQEISARNDLQVANGLYQNLTGLNADEVQAIPEKCLSLSAPAMDLKEAMQLAAQNNIEVRAAQFQIEQAKADVIAANGVHLPVVTLQASYGANWSRGEGENALDSLFGTTSKSRNSQVGVYVSVPLLAGGGQLSQSREAAYRREQTRDLLVDAQRKARHNARIAYLGITNGRALWNAQNQAIKSAKDKMESTIYGRKLGLRTTVDELNAQQSYYESVRDSAQARYQYLNATLQLSAIVGRLGYRQLAAFDCE